MTFDGQNNREMIRESSPNYEEELLKEARLLGSEILTLVKARLTSGKLALAFVEEMNRTIVDGLKSPSNRSGSSTVLPEKKPPHPEPRHRELYGPANPRTVRVEALYEQDPSVGGCEIVFENDGVGLSGRTGDLVALCPRNDPDEVRQLLRAFNLRGSETVTCGNKSGPAWRVLLEDVEIGKISESFREALRERINPRDKGLLTDEYIRTANPNLLALLRRFPTLGKCFEEFIESTDLLVPQKGFVVKTLGDRGNQLKVLLTESSFQNAKRANISLLPGAWVPVFIEQRADSHLSENGELPLVIITDDFGAQLATSYVAERQSLGHRGRIWIVVFGSNISPTLRIDFERWQQRGTITRFDYGPDTSNDEGPPSTFSSPMFWRWFVDRSAFCVIGVDVESTKALDRKILTCLMDGSGKTADWFTEPLAERRNTDLYQTVTLI
jgi:sulfite reductase (NADPH) flavoprotein alpha-component